MSVSEHLVSPDHLLHSVIGSGAALAVARRIWLDIALDKRLPDRIEADSGRMFLLGRALFDWALAGPGVTSITLALWQGGIDSRTPRRMCFEATGFGAATRPLPDGLAAQAAALDGQTSGPLSRPGAVAALVDLPLVAARIAQPAARRYADLFQGTRLLVVGDWVFDPARAAPGLAALGIDFATATPAGLADTLAAAGGRGFDYALITARAGDTDTALACLAALRAASPVRRVRVVLTGAVAAAPLPPGADFDLVVPPGLPPRDIVDVLADLMRPRRAANPARFGAATIPDFSHARILIAEDVRTNQTMMRAMLEPTGAAIEIANDGVEAVEMHRARPYSLVLMDIQMPRMDGLEATREIRAIGAAVPIIALTAHAKPTDRERYLAAGLDGYLAKPIRIAELYAIVGQHCGQPEPG